MITGEMVMVRREERRREKVAGRCVIAYGKFQLSGISGERECDLPRDLPGDARYRISTKILQRSAAEHGADFHWA
jgi:hypothetical protein